MPVPQGRREKRGENMVGSAAPYDQQQITNNK